MSVCGLIYLIALTSPIVIVSTSDHPSVESFLALHLALADAFGIIVYPEFVNCLHIFKVKLVETMQTHYLKMTPKVQVLVLHVLTMGAN